MVLCVGVPPGSIDNSLRGWLTGISCITCTDASCRVPGGTSTFAQSCHDLQTWSFNQAESLHPRVRRLLEMTPDRCCTPPSVHEVDGIAHKALLDASAAGQTSQHLRYSLPNYTLCTFTLSSHRRTVAQNIGHGKPFGVAQACSQFAGLTAGIGLTGKGGKVLSCRPINRKTLLLHTLMQALRYPPQSVCSVLHHRLHS